MESRIKNTKRNLVSGFLRQGANILLPFLTRTMVLYLLGAKYQGLSSLFHSILHVLNLADLGFTTAIVFVLYKPVALDDHESICAILAYLRKIYWIIGVVFLLGGLFVMPFLPSLISGSYPQDLNIYLLFFIYLIDTSLSYMLFGYKSVLLTAMQRDDVVNNIYTFSSTLLRIAQVIILFIAKDYMLFVALMPLCTLLNNFLTQYFANKFFPHLKPLGQIDKTTKEKIMRQVKGIVVDRIGDTARNSMDSIFLSAYLGLTTVAIYDNYYYIYSALYGITLMIINAMQASVGNSIVKESVEKNYRDLFKFTFIFEWICGWMAICMCCLYQPFMALWLRDAKMIFPNYIMVMFCLYFYLITMNNTRNLYTSGAGLYWEMRVWYIIEAIGNIVLNATLGYFYGVTGIILATIITIVLFNFFARNAVLFAHYFKCSSREFYVKHGTYALITIVNGGITYFLTRLVPIDGFIGFIIMIVLCAIIPHLLYYLAYRKSDSYQEMVAFVKTVIKVKH